MSAEYEAAVGRLHQSRSALNEHVSLVAGAGYALDNAKATFEQAVAGKEAVEGLVRTASLAVRDAIFSDYIHAGVSPTGFASAIDRLCRLRGGTEPEDRQGIVEGAERAANLLMQGKSEIVVVFGQFVTSHQAIPGNDGSALTIVEADRGKFLDSVLTVDSSIEGASTGIRKSHRDRNGSSLYQKIINIEAFKHVATNGSEFEEIASQDALRRFEKQPEGDIHVPALIIGREAVGALLEYIEGLPDFTDQLKLFENNLARISEHVDLTEISALNAFRERYALRTLREFVRGYFYYWHEMDSWDFSSSDFPQILAAQGYELGSPKLLDRFKEALLSPNTADSELSQHTTLAGVVIEQSKLKLALQQMGFPDKKLAKELIATIEASSAYQH